MMESTNEKAKKPYSTGLFFGVFSILTVILTLGQVISEGKNGGVQTALILLGVSLFLTVFGLFRSYRELGTSKGAYLGLVLNAAILLFFFVLIGLFVNP